MGAAGVVQQGREAAEALMVDTISFADDDGTTTFNSTTGEYESTAGTVLYAGPCQVQVSGPSVSEAIVGEQQLALERIIVKIPVGSDPVPVNSVGTITAVGDASDPGLVGKRYRVIGSHAKTYATARRLPCELIS